MFYIPSLLHSTGLEPTYKELKLVKQFFEIINIFRLEPTYKELKLLLLGSNANKTLPRLEPTYKELKLNFVSYTSSITKRLEPTYKELKHIKGRLFYVDKERD